MATQQTISVPEAAELCGVSRGTINNWIQAKRLVARRTGRVYTIHTTDLLVFLDAMGKPIPAGLENEKFTHPLFRSFQHCWDYFGDHHHGGNCEACVVSKNNLAACFAAKKSNRLTSPKACHTCSYYHTMFFPRIRFILQLGIPAAACNGLYFWGANRRWAEICGVQPEAFIGMDIENVIHSDSLSTVISLLKKREMEEDLPPPVEVGVKTGAGAKRALSLSVLPLDEPAGASLLLGGLLRGR